jgi:hypothetical protein
MKAFASCGMISVALVFSLCVIGPAGAHEDHGPTGKKLFTKHFQETLFDVTAHASYSVEVLLEDKEHKIGKNVTGVVVHDAHDEDVKGAEIVIVHKNLSTGENAPGTLTVADKGNGLYIISGLNLRRDGRWELAITIKKDGLEDRAKFVLPDAMKERVPKGRYSP